MLIRLGEGTEGVEAPRGRSVWWHYWIGWNCWRRVEGGIRFDLEGRLIE